MDYMRQFTDWPEFHTIVKMYAERHVRTDVTDNTRYYMTDLDTDAQETPRVGRDD